MRIVLAAACAASLLTLAACGAGTPAGSEYGSDAAPAETAPATESVPAAQDAPAADAELETIRFAVSGMG